MSKILTLDALHIEKLLSPNELKNELPASPNQLQFVQESRKQISSILNGEDNRLLLIVGPCSIHDPLSAKEYALKLRALSESISKHFFVVMRTYFEKPRTTLGWKGMLYDPHLNGSNDILSGLRQTRELLLSLSEMNVPAATEFLDPITPRYIGDLVSWACIGARTTESQIHRQVVSGLPMPVSFKNNTSGNIDVAVNGVLSATCPHAFFGIDDSGHISIMRTQGNPHAHITLRGGNNKPNYDAASIRYALDQLNRAHLPQRILIDCSHDNSNRKHEEQHLVFQSVIDQFIQGNGAIRGLILESHLNAGNQQMHFDRSRFQYAVSVTDPCLDWASTEALIRWGADMLEGKTTTAESPIENVCLKT